MRQLSQDGIDLIKGFEGFRASAYRDSGGVWTVGYGHTAGVKPGMKVTGQQAELLLRADVMDAIKGLYSVHKAALLESMPDPAYSSLVSFVYNLGIGTYRAGSLPKLVEAGNPIAVARKMREYVYCDGKKLQGLVNRRAKEASMYESAVWVKPIPAPPSKPAPQPVPEPVPEPPAPPERNVGAWVSAIILAICGLIAAWLGWG